MIATVFKARHVPVPFCAIMRHMQRLLLTLLLAAVPLFADAFDSVRATIHRRLTETRVASVSIAVAKDGKIIWEEGFGWANREKRIAATPHTMYSLASISKPITATGLMKLVEAGTLKLDEPVNRYLGDAKLIGRAGDASEATVRRVANHTSGLPLHYQFFYADEPYLKPSMDETILRYGNLVMKPGERYHYSNLGYGILGYLSSRISGKSYADFMREEVFQPLGLTHMSVDIGPGLEEFQAVRYTSSGMPLPFYDFDHPAASAVYASAHDLVRFGMFHLKDHLSDQNAILSDTSINEMQRPTAPVAPNVGYGVGWRVQPAAKGTLVSHSGGMGGVSTLLLLVPEHHLSVALLTNGEERGLLKIADDVIPIVVPGWQPPSTPAEETSNKGKLSGTWRGQLHTYEADLPVEMKFLESGDVHVQVARQMKTLLNGVRFSEGWLSGQFRSDVGTEDAGRRPYVLSLLLKQRGNMLNGSVTAQSLPGKRSGNALTYWIELTKQ